MTDALTDTARPPAIPGPRYPFARAVKAAIPARILIDGPSGAGGTYTSLKIATALGGTICVIDTQHGHASQYADEFTFDTCPPLTYFSPETLVDVLAHCAAQRYENVIIDSLTPFWSGHGGTLEQVSAATARNSGGTQGGWNDTRPRERRATEVMLAYPGNLLATVRTKTDYVLETDDRGRQVTRRVGLKPEQREGLERDFTLVASMDWDNTLIVSKALGRDLSGEVVRRPGADFGARIKAWVEQGEAIEPTASLIDRALDPKATFEGLGSLMHTVRSRRAEWAPLLTPCGVATTLGEYITERGKALRDAQPPTADPA